MDRAENALAQWRKARPDVDVSPMAVIGRLSEAAWLVSRDHLEPLFTKMGLRSGEFDVLATLRRSGPPFALTPTALYEATMVTSGAMTGRLDRLERAGFIRRGPHPTDRRGVVVELTAQGRSLVDDILVAHVENERKILAGLSAEEQAQLAGLLKKLIATLPK